MDLALNSVTVRKRESRFPRDSDALETMPGFGDLFDETLEVALPTRYSAKGRVAGNLVFHVDDAPAPIQVRANIKASRGTSYLVLTLPNDRVIAVSDRDIATPKDFFGTIKVAGAATIEALPHLLKEKSARWRSPRALSIASLNSTEVLGMRDTIRAS